MSHLSLCRGGSRIALLSSVAPDFSPGIVEPENNPDFSPMSSIIDGRTPLCEKREDIGLKSEDVYLNVFITLSPGLKPGATEEGADLNVRMTEVILNMGG